MPSISTYLNTPVNTPCCFNDNVELALTLSGIAVISSIALAIILSGVTAGSANYILIGATFSFDGLVSLIYIASIAIKDHKAKKALQLSAQPESISSPPPINTSTQQTESFDDDFESEASPPASPKKRVELPLSSSPPITPKKDPLQVFVDDFLPTAFHSLGYVLEKVVRFDSSQAGESSKQLDEKLKKLHSALNTFCTHFQNLASQPKPYHPEKETQIIRRMLAVWNTGQYELLPKLFHEFDLVMDPSNKTLLDPKIIKTEEDLKDVVRRLLFHCSLMLGDITTLLKESTSDQQAMKEANVYYLLQETKELATTDPAALDELKRIFNLQADINRDKIWNKWVISNSLEYMIVRRPSSETETTYQKMLKRIRKVTQDEKDYTSLLPQKERTQYCMIYCTLGTPGTWNLKRYELTTGFGALKFIASKVVSIFKGQLTPLIRDGLVKEQLVEKGDTSLDSSMHDFVNAILHPFVHILMKNYEMDRWASALLLEAKQEMERIHELSETESMETVLEILKQTFIQMADRHEQKANQVKD